MGFRTVIFTKPCRLSLKLLNLCYREMGEEDILVALEDISVIVLETSQITITSALLSQIADFDIALFACDESHIPNGLFLPFHQHSRYTLMAHSQAKWKEPFKKQCWCEIVKSKITNQASALSYLKLKGSKTIKDLSLQVKSGDTTNIESYAAKEYFRYLFGAFNRKNDDDWRNKALNYGYAIVRGVIARDLVASGFIPSFGLHHSNQLNAFNLADDMIEPLRAFVDIVVYERYEANIDEIIAGKNRLTPEDKHYLCEILNITVFIEEHTTSLLNACEIMCSSLSNATKTSQSASLILPIVTKDVTR